MNPVNLQNIDPNVLMAAVQMIQNANAQPQEIQLPDGGWYSGMMQNNVPHGKGIVKYRQPNEEKRLSYEGEWIDGKATGSGTIQYVDGGSYLGEMKDDKQHGKGYRKYAESDDHKWKRISYDGDWVDGNRHGFGTMLWANQNKKHVGQWENDEAVGQGTLTWIEKKQFDKSGHAGGQDNYERSGTFKEGFGFWEGESKRNGKVEYEFKNGRRQDNCIIS